MLLALVHAASAEHSAARLAAPHIEPALVTTVLGALGDRPLTPEA
jgi:hypothetical protein